MLIYIALLILVLLLLLPMVLISFVRSILSSVFGFNIMRKNRHRRDAGKDDAPHTGYETGASGARKQPRKKIFDKDDGEYVDFEEIK